MLEVQFVEKSINFDNTTWSGRECILKKISHTIQFYHQFHRIMYSNSSVAQKSFKKMLFSSFYRRQYQKTMCFLRIPTRIQKYKIEIIEKIQFFFFKIMIFDFFSFCAFPVKFTIQPARSFSLLDVTRFMVPIKTLLPSNNIQLSILNEKKLLANFSYSPSNSLKICRNRISHFSN